MGVARVGGGTASPADDIGNRSLVIFDHGEEVTVQAGEMGMRFLLVSGKPIEEPVAWYGPIVMNTQAELRQAISELNQGTLYPALVRLEQQGLIKGAWQKTENNRDAKYYAITKAGLRALDQQTARWRRLAGLVDKLLLNEG